MTLNNILDYMEEGQGIHIPDFDHEAKFPFFINEDGMIIDRDGAPAIFYADMLDSYGWDIYERLPDSGS